jgi:carboxymethylenebutenolidase
MCDDNDLDQMHEALRSRAELTRRGFASLTVGAGVAAIAASPAMASSSVREAEVEIKTPDGVCDAYFAHPARGKHPGVLIWADIFGLRPAFRQMARRLAESGYAVLVPNPFYRSKRAPVVPLGASLQDPETRATLMGFRGSLTNEALDRDAAAYIGFLERQRAVNKRRKMGTTGYCMGGSITMRTAAAFPQRIGAAASFHGGGLATDKPDSPHLLVPKMRTEYLIAIAENDDAKEPDAKGVLKQAFEQAKLRAEIEVYAGAMHGWCPPDSAVYNEAQAERAWSRMLAMFERALA